MAEEHAVSAEGSFGETDDGTRSSVIEEETTTTTIKSSSFSSAKEEWSSTSTTDAIGCATLPDPAQASSSEYFSTRIHSIMESKSELGSTLQAEIEASKDHWSELQSDSDEEYSAEANLEVYPSLRLQWPNGFFLNWDDDVLALGEKIAEGAQGEIIKLRYSRPEDAHLNDVAVLKVFKEGFSLQNLQKQWPQSMLPKANTTSRSVYSSGFSSTILKGLMLTDGRFAFVMRSFWGDLRNVLDLRMEHNGTSWFWRAPPFADVTALQIMLTIARGMRELHRNNIIHPDLKASNVLVAVPSEFPQVPSDFDPIKDDCFYPFIADYECSVGVVGTGFYRAPEILLGVKNGNVHPSLFTEKSDIYSYAMTCYEILTGKMPLEDMRAQDYDAILQGTRPMLPGRLKSWVGLLIQRCWHHEPSQRPSFEEIVEEFNCHGYRGLTLEEISGA